jgi:hypothetical protein
MTSLLRALLVVMMLSFAGQICWSTNAPVITHARATVNIQQNQNYFVALKWAVPFSDNKYTASCSPVVPPSLQGPGAGIYLLQITHISPASIQVETAASGVPPAALVHIDCIGLHD